MLNLPDAYFDPHAAAERLCNLWFQVVTAHLTRDPEPLKPYFSEELYALLQRSLDGYRSRNVRYVALRPSVLQSEITYAGVRGGRQEAECALFTRLIPSEQADGSELNAYRGREVFSHEVWTLSRPRDAVTRKPGTAVSTHCEGCGAPLSLYKSAKCPFCGKLVAVPDFNWTVQSVTGANHSMWR